MPRPSRLLGACLVVVLSGCFQVQLYGPVSGSRVEITVLRDTADPILSTQASTLARGREKYGAEKWREFGPNARLWNLGVFEPDKDLFTDSVLYLMTARRGYDTDADLDGRQDTRFTAVAGDWHSLASGAQLRAGGPKISALTEIVYQWLAPGLETLDDAGLLYNMDLAAGVLVGDVNEDGNVDYRDLLRWNRLLDGEHLKLPADQLDRMTAAVHGGLPERQKQVLARELLGMAVTTCTPACPASAADQLAAQLWGLSFDTFMETSWAALLGRAPEDLLSLGIATPEQVALDDISDAYQRETASMLRVVASLLPTADDPTLSQEQQLTNAIYRHYLEDQLALHEHRLITYPASSFITGVPNQTEFLFSDLLPLVTAADARIYVDLLDQVARKFDQLRDGVLLRAEAGVIEPGITLDLAIRRIRGVARANPADTNYYTRLNEALAGIGDLETGEAADLLARALQVIEGPVQAAYTALVVELEDLDRRSPTAIGVGQFPGGPAYYRQALLHHTGTRLTADQIHQLGMRELERVESDIRAAAEALGIDGNQSLVGIFTRAAQVGGAVSGNDILTTYEALIDRAQPRLAEAFNLLPEQQVVVIGGATGGFYVGPSEDGSRPGAFYAATVGEEPYYLMPSLAYHEALPGHHLQVALARELDLPDFRRHTTYTGFVEGWALYAERLAFELGWYESDPWGNLGRLQFEAIRAARLVVDTGIHDRGWSWQQAVDFYRNNTGSSEGAAQGAVARFMRWPGQATAYMVGMLEILELRERASNAAGDDWDLATFHDVVIGGGAMPLVQLREVVESAYDLP